VEATPGSGTIQHIARRKNDAVGSTLVRNLDWGTAKNDIALHPQSALSIASALETVATSITLLPVPDIVLGTDDDAILISTEPGMRNGGIFTENSNVTPIINRNDNRDRTMSVNLLTLQVAMELREKCKRLALESALVRNRRERQLYLAVGMLHWTGKSSSHQSPLLFYPVTLISEASRNGVGYVHQLYNAEGIPDYNHHLRDSFRQQTGITLPEFHAQQSIETFLKKVLDRTSKLDSVRVDATMRLGIATTPAGLNPALPESHHSLIRLPTLFVPSLAAELMANHSMEDLQLTLNLLDAGNDYGLAETTSDPLTPTADLAALRDFATELIGFGIGHVEFQQLSDIPERIDGWIAAVEPVLESELINSLLQQRDIKAVQLMQLSGIIELLDKAPDSVDTAVHRDLAFTGTPMLFKRARHQAKLIEDELTELQQHFHLDRLPAKSQLLQLIEELGGSHSTDIEVIDSDYFNARRQFMDFSTDRPTTLSEDHKRLLNKLVKVLRFRELFVNNTEYRLALGPAYRGLKTDWRKLEQVLHYAQELRTVLGSESIAANALNDWQRFHQVYSRSLSQLQAANVGLRGMLQVLRPTDKNTTANELLIKSKCLAEELLSWKAEPAFLDAYPERTAHALLRLLSSHRNVDELTESLVQDAHKTIRLFLKQNVKEQARVQLSTTLVWLQNALGNDDLSLDIIREAVDHAVDNSADA